MTLLATSWLHAEVKKVIDTPIVLAAFSGTDSTQKSNQVIVVGKTVFRTFDALLPWLSERKDHPEYPTRYVIYGDCDVDAVQFNQKEIDAIKNTCTKAGVRFYYYPAG